MKIRNSLLHVALVVTIFTFAVTGCENLTEGEENAKAKFKVSFVNKTTTSSLAKINTPNTVMIDSGYVIIREIVFDGEKAEGGSVSITHEQISTISIATGKATPEIEVTIPSGKYKDVNLGVEIHDETNKPSIVAKGVYTDNSGVKIPIRFEFNSGEVFEANAKEHTFASGASALAQINFSPSKWFSTVQSYMLENATKVNGVILINENTNTSIFNIVADKLDDLTQAEFK
ncbi:MAG: hypothetical protein FD143_2542 [Ignavibacteria bacterium]|nr:MAG: hypothetical protein FD143_2542 [Ignavibacteria bacterium]KAF0156386.1 MAG: hypothetical protein FD188_2956 [Ignavibacteria bacterium]